MSRSLPIVVALVLVGCAHEEELRPAAEPTTFSMAPPPPAPVVIAEPPPNARPRLSQTVTLGQQDDYAPAPGPAPQGQQSSGVVVNNNITVNPPAYYGGGYYGGYGGYGGGRGTGDGGRGVGRSSGPQAWRPSGWEGAQRTAAPGQTPGVGGNYSPPPSSGPATMK